MDFNKLNANYLKYSPYPEAGIVPDTYHIPIGTKEEKLISFLVKSSEKRYEQLAIKELQRYDKKEWLLYLKIASNIRLFFLLSRIFSANPQIKSKAQLLLLTEQRVSQPLQLYPQLQYCAAETSLDSSPGQI